MVYLGFYFVSIYLEVTNSRGAHQWRIYDLSKLWIDGLTLIKSCTGLYLHQLLLALRIIFQKSVFKVGGDFLLRKYATGWINVTKYFSKQFNYKIIFKYITILRVLNHDLTTFFQKYVFLMSYCINIKRDVIHLCRIFFYNIYLYLWNCLANEYMPFSLL